MKERLVHLSILLVNGLEILMIKVILVAYADPDVLINLPLEYSFSREILHVICFMVMV